MIVIAAPEQEPTLYYTTPQSKLRLSDMPHGMPTLVTATSAMHTNSRGEVYLRDVKLPHHITTTAADCGGYPIVMRYGGHYPFPLEQYIMWLLCWKPEPPKWAAMFDLCSLDATTKRAASDTEIKRRQDWTSDQAFLCWQCHKVAPWAWVPTVQGYTIEQYRYHAEQLAPLIYMMIAYYTAMADLDDDPEEQEWCIERLANFRVGIGSLASRGRNVDFITEVVRVVQEVLGAFVPLHLWGVKLAYLNALKQLLGVISYDTASYTDLYAEGHERQKESGLSRAEYSLQEGQRAYAEKVDATFASPQQLILFPTYLVPAGYNEARVFQQMLNELADQ